MSKRINGEKKFSLRPIELQMLATLNEGHRTDISTFLSYIAIDRLNYTVTPNTQFSVDETGMLTAWEDSGIEIEDGSTDTAQAISKK